MIKENKRYHKYKLISCNNPTSAGYDFVDVISLLQIEVVKGLENEELNKIFFFSRLRSSLIKDVKEEDNKVIIYTLNTEYVFEEVKENIKEERWNLK